VTALLLFEVIDTALAIANAILAWIAVAAFAGTVVLFTTMLAVAHGWKAARRRSTGPLAAEQPAPEAESIPTPQRRTEPAWAHTEHEEAA
jgi:hypothetical protein